MLLPWIGFLLLLAWIPTLLFVAHMFALSRQDRHKWFVVIFDDRVRDVGKVTEEQAASYKLLVERTFDGQVKGYTALVPLRYVEKLKADRRVSTIAEQEPEEFAI